MTNKEFRKLKQSDMLDIIYKLQLNEQELTAKVEELEKTNAALKEENNVLKEQAAAPVAVECNAEPRETGSIADAVLSISNIFAEAQKTADKFVEDVKNEYAAFEQCNTLRRQQAESEAAVILTAARAECDAMRSEADAEIKAKWQSFNENVRAFMSSHEKLKSMFGELK